MIIFTNQRAIRNYIATDSYNRELEDLITISDFLDKVIYIPNFQKISNLDREIIFNSVVSGLDIQNSLKIDTNIFNFLSYSPYFLSFFKELAEEGISIDEVAEADYYEDYQKHIQVLKLIYEEYKKEMESKKLIDAIFTPLNYRVNIPYLQSIETIEYRFDGRPSNFDIELFRKIAEQIPVTLSFTRSRFNYKIDKQIGFELKPNIKYLIDFSKKEILLEDKVEINGNFEIYGFQNRFTQIGFVQERIYYFHKVKKVPLEKIGVILLDEKFAKNLQVLNKTDLDFAMGGRIQETEFFKFLNAISIFIENSESVENKARRNIVVKDSEELKEIFHFFIKNTKNRAVLDFKNNIQKLLKLFNLPNKIILQIIEILKLFDSPYLENLHLRIMLKLFLNEIMKLQIDDLADGKVKVQGLLETRGTNYKAVIILDFNDEVFPKKEEKDFFINSEIRREVGLPLIEDREGLQKLYLEALLQKAEFGAISFLDNEISKVSRFFYDFDFNTISHSMDYEKSLIQNTMQINDIINHWDNDDLEVFHRYIFSDKTISNTRLKIFLECPRRFYFLNILEIKEHSIHTNVTLQTGNILHKVLERVYKTNNQFLNKTQLYQNFETEFIKDNKLPKIFVDSWLQKIHRFVDSEIQRFENDKIVVVDLERDVKAEYRGFKLHGKIDRIDRLPNGDLILIDYKLSEPSKSTKDFQLIFYYILLKEQGEQVSLDNLYFYNLTSGELIPNKRTIQEFDAVLDNLSILEQKPINFEKSTKCDTFCPYKIMCDIQS